MRTLIASSKEAARRSPDQTRRAQRPIAGHGQADQRPSGHGERLCRESGFGLAVIAAHALPARATGMRMQERESGAALLREGQGSQEKARSRGGVAVKVAFSGSGRISSLTRAVRRDLPWLGCHSAMQMSSCLSARRTCAARASCADSVSAGRNS